MSEYDEKPTYLNGGVEGAKVGRAKRERSFLGLCKALCTGKRGACRPRKAQNLTFSVENGGRASRESIFTIYNITWKARKWGVQAAKVGRGKREREVSLII